MEVSGQVQTPATLPEKKSHREYIYTEPGTKKLPTRLHNTIRLAKLPFILCFSSRGN
jgi:hypothetical protein